MTLFTPRATGPSSIDLPPPSPMPTEPINHDFARGYKTWFGPASDCGYWGDSGTYGCDDNYICRFHSSHAGYPGMMGCCSKGPAGPCNGFFSTCYGRHEISKTPSLLSSTDDFFAMFCTKDDSPYCLPWTWPEIGVSAFECTNFTLSETATIETFFTHTNIAGFGKTAVFVVSISWIEDPEMITRLDFKPTKPATSQSSRSTATNTSESSSGPSPILVGVLVGSVVGGFASLSATVIILWMLRKGRLSKDKTSKSPMDWMVIQYLSPRTEPESRGIDEHGCLRSPVVSEVSAGSMDRC
ncbi:hypothetical protein BDV36DRAFT_281576 [Aspergillus pseudocaelatus]|uniref:Uncharacterized protein n=1 Tax=Aspergillus pseudocaelatus TaxID=1825620 RepID=A0ABQ6WT11_9EURO|nr:hypothetical protein BDV36DRAFT_281576 [Aspergillus pseudocaelatus]